MYFNIAYLNAHFKWNVGIVGKALEHANSDISSILAQFKFLTDSFDL